MTLTNELEYELQAKPKKTGLFIFIAINLWWACARPEVGSMMIEVHRYLAFFSVLLLLPFFSRSSR